MIFTLLTTLLFQALNAQIDSLESFKLQTDNILLDQSCKVIQLDQNTIILTQHFRTYESLYQIELMLLDVQNNKLIKRVLVGNQMLQHYHPQIILINKFIYIIYVNQDLSIVKLGLKKYDLNLVEQSVEYTLGDSLESAKFDKKMKYIKLTALNDTSFSIFWKQRSQSMDKYQWSYVKYDTISDTSNQILSFPDSNDISIAQNRLGIIGILQTQGQNLQITKLENDKITEIIQTTNAQTLNQEILSLPNNEFVVYQKGYQEILFTRYDWQLQQKSDFYLTYYQFPVLQGIGNNIAMFQNDYNLFLFYQGYYKLNVAQFDLASPNIEFIQLRQIMQDQTQEYWLYQTIDSIQFNQLSIKWMFSKNFNYELHALNLDMNSKQNECKFNCKICDPQLQCITCLDGYTYNNIKNECVPQCPDNCQLCTNPKYCTKCKQGFQYTSENLCVTPQYNSKDLIISDEQQKKGQVKFSVVDNEFLLLYSLLDDQIQKQLILRKLNSIGALIKQITIQQQPSQILDFDLSTGNDEQDFHILIKWLTVDSIVQIIDYRYDLETLSIMDEKNLNIVTQSMNGNNQIKIIQLKGYGIGYLYLNFNEQNQYYEYSYLRIENNIVTQEQKGFSNSLRPNLAEISVNQNAIYFNFTTVSAHYSYSIELTQIRLLESNWLENYFQKYIKQFRYGSLSILIDSDEYLNKQLFVNFTESNPPKLLKITQSSRNPQSFTFAKIRSQKLAIVWLGQSNIELQNPINQIFIQSVDLEKQELANFKDMICSKNCASCTEQGQCIQCKSTKHQLQNGKCILTCENNCEYCEVENQCLQCANGYYLNENLLCDQSQEQQIYQQDNLIYSYILSIEESIFQVSLKKNNSRFDVVFEEFNRQGQSISGEIKVSSELDLVVPTRPKMIKIKNQIVIQYVIRSNQVYNDGQFVILDQSYQQTNRFITHSLYHDEHGIDFIITNDLIIHAVSFKYSNDYWYGAYVSVIYETYRINYIYQRDATLNYGWSLWSAKFDKPYKFENLKILKNQFLSQITLSYTQIEDNVEQLKIISFDPQKYNNQIQLNVQENFEYYMNVNGIWIISYEKINSNLIKVKFYNEKQELKQDYIIESQNLLSSFQIQLQNQFVYFIFLEQQITNNNMNIQLIKFSLDGNKLVSKIIYTSELIIQDLSSSSSEDMIYLTWSSLKNIRTYKIRLNSQLNVIPFVEQICQRNCDVCDNNQVCKQCSLGYQYSEKLMKCEPICAQNCQSCQKPYSCDYCNGNSKYINQKCVDLNTFILESSVCEGTCYGLPSMIGSSDQTKIISYQKYEDQQYKINMNIYNFEQKPIQLDQNLVSQDQEIGYHQLYQQEENVIVLVWLTGNCQIQCRLMLQLFQKDFQILTNPYELRIVKVNINQFNLKISKFNNDLLFLWTELNQNDKSQIMLGQYSISSGFSLKLNVNENESDVASSPNLIVQSGYYQIVYIKNNYIINALTVDGSISSYKQIYTSKNQITSLAVGSSYYYGVCVIWVEKEVLNFYHQFNQLYVMWFDQNLNLRRDNYVLLTSYYEISQLQLGNYGWQFSYFMSLVIQEFDGSYRLRYKILDHYYSTTRQYELSEFTIVNVLSQFSANIGYRILSYSDTQSFLMFSGILGSSGQLFYYNANYQQIPSQDNCFQRNSKYECLLCKQGYYLFENNCEKQLPNHCNDGDNGICEVCNVGYVLTIDNICVLGDAKYKEMKMNTYELQSKQRITTFKNGDYVTVWYRQYYENQGTGVFMSMFNAHGKKILDETRISLSSAGIQIYPDVQAFDNDQFCAVWIEGDLQVQGKIKIQRFTKDFVRIGDEITVKENVQLKYAQRFDTPIMIQSIVNGYVVVWTQNQIESNILVEKLNINFYDLQDNQKGSFVLNNQESIRNSEAVVASNNQIIVIVWQSDLGIVASKFSLNYVYINQQILSSSGQAPSISVLSDNKFIITWRDDVINSIDIMNQNIMFRKYSSDLNNELFSYQIAIADHNMNNPDVISTQNGFAIIFESRHAMMADIRNLKMQLFSLDGISITKIIEVFNEQNLYPHHPQLTILPQGEFLASWTQSGLQEASLNDDLYMKRFNSNGIQLPLDTIVCPENCKQCNENDICQICMNNYVLYQKSCFQSIPHCATYSQTSVELNCLTCETDFKLIQNRCLQITKHQQLNVEMVNDVNSKFALLQLQNSDILFIWQQGSTLFSQRFDQYGNQYSASKKIDDLPQTPDNFFTLFDVCSIEDNKYIIATNSQTRQSIYFRVYNDSEQLVQQIEYNTNKYMSINQQYSLLILKHLGNNQIAVFYKGATQQTLSQFNIYMDLFKIEYQSNQISFQMNKQVLLHYLQEQFQSQTIDIEITNNQIQVWLENDVKSELRYLYKIFDLFGNLIKIQSYKNENYQIELKCLELEKGQYLEIWTNIVYSIYEVYYAIKLDNQYLFEPKKLSKSQELYKLDLKTHILSDSIVIIWREGSYKADMTANTNYKAVFISKQNYQQFTNPIQLNTDLVVMQGQNNILRLIELQNQDIVIGWISYNYLDSTNGISAVKLNKEGQILEFSKFRCSYGCQECTNLGRCLKCSNNDKYFLTLDGNCINKKGKCQNYQSDCQQCLQGYFQNKYLECNEIQQNVETDVIIPNAQIQRDNVRVASYKNGTFIVARYYSYTSIGIQVFNKEATQIRDFFMIFEMEQNTNAQSQQIMDFQIIIDDNDILTFSYVTGYSYYSFYYVDLVFEQYDNEFARIGNRKIIPCNNYVGNFYRSFITLKTLENNVKAVAILIDYKVILGLYSSDFSEVIGNTIIQEVTWTIDFNSNGEYFVFGYVKNQCDILNQICSVVKVYDKQLRFIKDLVINDGSNLQITRNAQKQFVVITKSQLNIIDKTVIIKSIPIDYQETLPISTYINENNEIVLFVIDLQSRTLLLLFFGENGNVRREVQVNMKSVEFQVQKLFLLQNSDVAILFTSSINYSQQLKYARFDQFGKSLSTTQIICPQNCEACFQTSTCNICKPGYNRNEQTLLCEKICTIEGCQSCEQSDCDVCKDGMFINFDGKCLVLVQDPTTDSNVRYSINSQFNTELQKKVLKYSNNNFALIYAVEGLIKITKFNAQGQEIKQIYFDLIPYNIISFDATIINNYIYIAFVSTRNVFSYQVYGLDDTGVQLTYLFENSIQYPLQSIQIKGIEQYYVILISFNQDYYDQGYMQCFTQSLYFYNEQNQLFEQLINYNNPVPLTQNECNQNKIKNLYIYQEILYVIITKFTNVKLIQLNRVGQFLGENYLELQNLEQIELTVDQEQIIVLYKYIGVQNWNFRIYNTQFQILLTQDNYLRGDLIVNMVTTSQTIFIAWSQKNQQSIVEFLLLNRLGQKIKSDYIKGEYSLKPQLTQLDNQKVCLVWSVWTNKQFWSLSYSLLDSNGEYIQFTEIQCPSNCLKCSDSSQCQQCEDGYQITFYYDSVSKLEYSQCSKKCDPFCINCQMGQCYQCLKDYYVNQNSICVFNEFENKAIQINEFNEFSQITPDAAKFKDGSILIAWTSNNQDEDSWGVFAQLLNNQGQKIGNNFRVSQSVFGAQHSPQVAVLEDDTAIISFIEGNPQIEAMIKGLRFNNKLEIIGNEQLFSTFKLPYFELNNFLINKIVSLKNGGFAIIWRSQNQINTQFYDSASNLVIQTQILDAQDQNQLEVAVTATELAILYRNNNNLFSYCVYTQDGVVLSNSELTDWDIIQTYELHLISVSYYFALAGIVKLPDQQQVKLQLYNSQFSPSGNPIIITQTSQSQQAYIVQYNQMELFSLNDGALLILKETKYIISTYRQFLIDINWQVTELLPFGFNNKQYDQESQRKVYAISNINVDQYFIYWSGGQYNMYYGTQTSLDYANIYIQRVSKQSQIVPIDQIVCPKNCLSCQTQTSCTQCAIRYQLQDQYCAPQCESNCQFCTVPKICEICKDGFHQKVQGKCSPIPFNYHEPEILMKYPFVSNIIDMDQLQNGQIIIYTQQTLFDQNKENFVLYVYQNNELLKQITVQTNTITTNYYFISPFYVDDNFYLIFHMINGIKIIKFNSQQEEKLNVMLSLENNLQNVQTFNVVLNPIENNQYSLLFYTNSEGVVRILYDQDFNEINKEQLFVSQQMWYGCWRTKNQLFLDDKGQKYTFTNSFVVQQVKQMCLFSELLQSYSCEIYQLSNGNKIQIIHGTQDIKYYGFYGSELSYQVFYRILDSQDTPLTREAQVLENTFSRQSLGVVFIFQDSFTILIEQPNYFTSENLEVYAQKFDNSGMKVGDSQFITFNKGWQRKFYKQTNNGYTVFSDQRIYDISVIEIEQKATIYYKQYDVQGNPISWSIQKNCIANCQKCINSYYCQECIENYQLDSNYKCKLTCQNNCNQCSSYATCESCDAGYKLVSGSCAKIVCISNCAQCSEDTTSLTTTICKICDDNYYLSSDSQQCLPQCPSNCSQCTIPLQCEKCAFGYIVTTDKKCQQENSSILDQIKNTTVGTPLVATFPDGSYILLWYQNGENAGVYFQLYSADNVKVGDPLKVTGNVRRILNQQTITQSYYADLIAIDYEFFVTWMDASSEQTDVKLKKFSSDGESQSQDILLGTHQKSDLQQIKLPCQIKKTLGNSLLIAYTALSEQKSDDYSIFLSSFDSSLNIKSHAQEIKNVNKLAAPSLISDENGIISLTYQSDGYVFVQQITQDGELIDTPKAIADSDSINLRVTNLANGIMVFLWENKNLQLSQPQFILNYQLISKDLKTRSEVKSVGDIQLASLTPDIQSFNEGFIIAWKITDNNYKSIGLQFQIFDSLGTASTQITEVEIEGIYPQTPRIQIINDNQFAVTWSAKNIDSDGTILGDGIFMQKYNKYGTLITDSSSSTDLCSYQCQSCQSPLVCLKCQYGFYIDTNNQCVMDCGSFCDSCEIPWTCQVCKNGYQLNNNDACIETECLQGYFRNTNTKLCEPECPDECNECAIPNVCLTCKSGYSLSDSSCISSVGNTELDDQSTIMAIVIIILAAAFISVSACSITLYCKYKKLLKVPSHCQVHPIQDINKSVSNISCNASVIRLRQND